MTVSRAYADQERAAVQSLLDLGVQMGAQVSLTPEERAFGHINCTFHLTGPDGYDLDGGAASVIHSLLVAGTYGVGPDGCILHPCRPATARPC